MWDNRKIKVNIRTRRYAYDFPGNINGDGTDINLFPTPTPSIQNDKLSTLHKAAMPKTSRVLLLTFFDLRGSFFFYFRLFFLL